ncbi:MAG: signal recognition particle-docking protein FtsY [Flavobacteriaceae bacterium]|jgi:fused signal recognition particle receptor|nr:signal recognition particle-docking protein FtsY [Flavobacteriaceae bacterium]MDG0967860.1 signal recognition particle-docking protein FtsY [Flavobacteriaceae bacterium]
MGILHRFFSKKKLDKGLEPSKKSLFEKIGKAVAGKSTVDAAVLDQLEEILISADIGVDTTLKIIDLLEKRVSKDKYMGTEDLHVILREEIANLLQSFDEESQLTKPLVTLVVGVNGAGKTTTIGKLAHLYKAAGKKVLLGAADTFRAAAVDQLVAWAERVGVAIVKQKMGSDPASVAYDAVKAGLAQGMDHIIIDTAGRLHNKVNLMNELSKIKRVIQKAIPEAPHQVLLVLDGSTGQNAFEQARQFAETTEISALAITKLDGTAKGGVVIGISDQLSVPVKYIGVGEGADDMQEFQPNEFVDSLFSN